MIVSFADKATEGVWSRRRTPRIGPDLHRTAYKKLLQLDIAGVLDDLRVPPGNRLERLTKERAGQHSIRVNDQCRICFVWTDVGPADVELTDYH